MSPRTRSVLVVEDEPLIALDLQLLLEERGYEVVGPASTVADALECIREHALRAALVDVNLGGEYTAPVITELLSSSVPVVLLTGYSSKTTTPPYNACAIVRKPYDQKNLLQVLEYATDHMAGMSPVPAHAPRSTRSR